jgi:Second Messenger Oligonucleotide or Dinucleotide Synthetase domain
LYSTDLGRYMGSPLYPPFGVLASQGTFLGRPTSPYTTLLGTPSPALSLLSQPAAPTLNWEHVRGRFRAFINNLAITHAQREDGETKQAGVRACLNRHYYGASSETANSILIGSWGKATRVRPSRDVDILFLLPESVYWQYQSRTGNRQSALLQEVRNVLLDTYSQTNLRGDGQVVVIPFNHTPVEVAPGFRCTDGSILVCDTNDGGRYIFSTAEAEEKSLSASDTYCIGNIRTITTFARRRRVPDLASELFEF